jgi:hypothetical protein
MDTEKSKIGTVNNPMVMAIQEVPELQIWTNDDDCDAMATLVAIGYTDGLEYRVNICGSSKAKVLRGLQDLKEILERLPEEGDLEAVAAVLGESMKDPNLWA